MSDSRKEFELWATTSPRNCNLEIDLSGDYISAVAYVAWDAWQSIQKKSGTQIGEPALNSIHETLKLVWSREYSADDGIEEIEMALMGYEFCPPSAVVPEPFWTESACQTAKESILTGSNMVISCDLVRELVEALRKTASPEQEPTQ